MEKCVVYWIKHPSHIDITSEGYVGVTTDYDDRMRDHSKRKRNTHISKAVRKYNWDSLEKSVIVIGSLDYCLYIEEQLRPRKNIGWNMAKGGKPANYGKIKPKTNGHTGTITITDGVVERKIKNDQTIPEGWRRGRPDALKVKMSGKGNHKFGKPSWSAGKTLHYDVWNKGKILGPNPEHSARLKGNTPGNKGTRCITNGIVNKYTTELPPEGWWYGMKAR